MKKQMKNIILTVATLFLVISSVSAATININLSDGTKKTYEIKESEYDKTIYDFKKSIEKVSQGGSTTSMKRLLLNMVIAQKQVYLLDSLYFMEL